MSERAPHGDGHAAEPGLLFGEVLPETLDQMEAIGGNPEPYGVPTGFRDFDDHLGGLRRGLLHILFGTSGIGSSTLAIDLVRSAAIKHGQTTLIFSGQSPRIELVNRILSAEARVPLSSIRLGFMKDEEWTRVARRMSEITDAPLLIDHDPDLTAEEITAKCRRAKTDHDLRLVVVDGANLYARPTTGPDTFWAAQAALSAELKRLACSLNVAVVATVPVNRRPDQRIDRRPTLSDIASSSAYAADADIVIGIHREDAYERESPRAGEADLTVLKNRYGPTGSTVVAYQAHYSRFVDMLPDPPKGTEDGTK